MRVNVESLLAQMHEAGFVDPVTHEIQVPFALSDATPYRERAFSCLHLITESEFQSGLARLESDLRKGPVGGLTEYVCIWARTIS